MKAGIIGLPVCGKTTLFNVLTKRTVHTGGYGGGSEPNIGIVKVPDARLETLSQMFEPKKTTYATVEYVDVAGFTKGSVQDGGLGSQLLAHIRNVDVIIQVVRTFFSETVPLPEGGIDPARDIETLHLELMLADLAIVEKRIERLHVDIQKKGEKSKEKELHLIERLRDHLEQETPIREIELNEEEERLLRGYQFLTQKPLLIVLNIGEDELTDPDKYQNLIDHYQAQGVPTLALSAEIESEIEQLEEEADVQAFMEEMGIEELGLTKLIHASYALLGLISFFTVGKNEVRAWTIPQGTTAVKAAGVVHSDLERGFIRAEVIHYDALLQAGSLAQARQQGILRVEGKDYIVQDGEILTIRFNV
ncbi:redox-regulated ATPase YchF [candidate division KSB3 bacterium]|uniref:Ribosome-binding ATPase YchF n=1 Tax=candidate division KSB3 bacterium TaxID=2044937 RepID=A0A9D5Q631_9BACT|nr:redox-regulated ATPase YchF [candidate division KSB3 bacterium]MBD3324988.1 redox-regulated ATPase YchF [candidate division KSB3 bacterium]